MQAPAQTTANGVASSVVRTARCHLLFATVQNTSGAARFYAFVDAATAPTLLASNQIPPNDALISPRIAAGQTWTAFPSDASTGRLFSTGCVLLSFGVNADGSPNYTALSAADANLIAWSALMA